jgi:hypothetical protein
LVEIVFERVVFDTVFAPFVLFATSDLLVVTTPSSANNAGFREARAP